MNAQPRPNSTEHEARRDLAAAHRLAVHDGLNEGTWNHLSVVLPDAPDRMMISPGYTHWGDVTMSNIATVDDRGTLLSGERAPIVAGSIIHFPVHRSRPDAVCVMHVHAPYSTALSMQKDIRLDTQSSQQAAGFHDDVAYYDEYDGLLEAEEEGYRMAEALGDKRVLLMRNHGALVAGPSVGRAYVDLYQLERACMYQVLATSGGTALNQIPEPIAASMGERARAGQAAPNFEGMRHYIEKREPDLLD